MLSHRHTMAMAGFPIAVKEVKREKSVVSEEAPQKRFQKEITAEKAPVEEMQTDQKNHAMEWSV